MCSASSSYLQVNALHKISICKSRWVSTRSTSLKYCPLLSSRPPTYGRASQTAGEQKQYTTHLLPTLNLHHPLPQRATYPRKQSSTHPIRNSRTSKRPALVCKLALHLPLRPPCLLVCSLQPPRPPPCLNLKGQWSGQTEDMSAMCSSSDGWSRVERDEGRGRRAHRPANSPPGGGRWDHTPQVPPSLSTCPI